MECPVCLETLEGTVVQLGCCKNQVHIQCYLPKCPLCRAELPMPRPAHVIIPVPVAVPTQNAKKSAIISSLIFVGGFAIFGYFIFVPH